MDMKRRAFIQQTSAVVASAAFPVAHAAEAPLRIVDTHTHFYDPTRAEGVPWPEAKSPLYRPVYPKDWKAVANPCGVTGTIVVEASKWLEDNQWILDLAAKETCIFGFVGRLQPNDPEFPAQLKRFAANVLFRGIRVSGKDFTANVENVDFIKGIKLLAENDLSLDVNGGPAVNEAAAKLATIVPDLRIVVDHIGGAGDVANVSEAWRDSMKALGKQKNVFCKVSALPEQTKFAWGEAPCDGTFYRPVLDCLSECFDETRLVYGSNWPVSDKGAPYEVGFRIVREYFTAKGGDMARKFFWENAQAAYRFRER